MTRLCICVWDGINTKSAIPRAEKLRKNPESHQQMMELLKENPQFIEPYQDSYNCVDGEELTIKDIKILHYSDMGTQFSHKYALGRVSEEGFEHWFDGKIMPHPRQELAQLFDSYYNEALAAGYQLNNYRVDAFGSFPKKTNRRYKR